jgi:tetratricopeptide (TPR) repeat protein
VLVHGDSLLARTETASPENVNRLRRLKELIERKKSAVSELEQKLLFEQFTNVLLILADHCPLVLFLDDMQWADSASIDLFFHLGRRIEGHPILLAAAFRQDEVALGRDDDRHPLDNVVNELKRIYGDVLLDLSQEGDGEDQDFVELFIDTEPNHLSSEFRQTLKSHTGGHPLFTIELLRAMMDRGDLIHDKQGKWIEDPDLSWELLPARVEAVIEERVERLDEDLREMLSIASVEGEEFTVQVIARVQNMEERPLQRRLSQELEKDHRLVRERDELKVDGRVLTRYRFAHQLYQHYLYSDLSAGERRLLHGDIAAVLEDLHQGETRGIAVRLAHHYLEAMDTINAVKYLLEAAELAGEQFANVEALKFIEKIIAFGPGVDLVSRMRALGVKNYVLHNLGDYDACLSNNETILKLAQESEDQNHLAEAFYLCGETLHYLGNLQEAVEALDQAVDAAKRAGNLQIEAKVLGFKVLLLTRFGEIEDAEKLAKEAIALAEKANDDLVLARNLTNTSIFYGFSGDLSRAVEMLRQQLEITRRLGSLKGNAIGLGNLGFNYVMLGMYPEGISSIEGAMEISMQIGNLVLCIHNSWNLCLANLRMGNPQEAVHILEEVDLDLVGKGFLEPYHSFYSGLAREGVEDHRGAKADFETGYEAFLEMDFKANAFDSLAGMARCSLILGLLEEAKGSAEELWNYLRENGSSGMELPVLSYLTCAEIFQEDGDTKKYTAATREGYQVLMEMAEKISDPDMRRSYLENVPEHRSMVELWEQMSG